MVPLQPRAGRLEGTCDPGTLKWRLGQALGEHSGCWKGHCGLHCTDLRGLLVSDGSGLGGHGVITPRAAPEASIHQLTALAGTSGTSSLAWGPSEVSGRVGAILNIDRQPLCSPPCIGLGVRPQGLSCGLWVPVAGSGPWSPGVTAESRRGLKLDLPRAAPSAAGPQPPEPLVWAGGCVLEGSGLGQACCPLGLSLRTLPKP